MTSKNLPSAIGRYEVNDRLGEGGMGVVYRGRDPRIGRLVAIKLLRLNDDGLRERFLQEARSAGNLSHPNIVTIFDCGEHEGDPFIVMEFVEGITLAEQIRRVPQPTLFRKLTIIEELSTGLDYAHKRGIVHRDVKPANVMFDRSGVLKILDFGIARVANSGLTQIGALMGTPNYMSPEQVAGRSVDCRSDIFAIGLTFYELLAGRQAFGGDSPHAVMFRIAHEDPIPLEKLCPDLDPAVVSTVRKTIEKEPGRRYQTAAALAAAIAKIRARLAKPEDSADESAIPTTPPLPPTTLGRRPTPRAGIDREALSKLRSSRIDSHLQSAQAAFDAGDYSGAADACEHAALMDPDEPRVLDLLERAREALATQRQRAEATAAALSRARDRLAEGQFESAIRVASEILISDPTNDEAHQLTRQARTALEERRQQEQHERAAKAAVEQQRHEFEQGRWHDAIDALSRFTPPHAIVSAALAEMRAEVVLREQRTRDEEERRLREEAELEQRQQEQERWVARQLELARASVDARRFADAVDTLGLLQQLKAKAPGLVELLADARAGQAELEAQAAVTSARRQFERGEHRAALSALESFRPAHSLTTKALEELASQLKEIERRRREAEESARAGAVRTKLEQARNALASKAFAEALRLLDEGSALDPANAEWSALRSVVRNAIEEARLAAEDERRARKAVVDARRRFASGARAAAIAQLGQFAPPHRLVSEALRDLQGQAAEIQRQEDAERRLRSERLSALLRRGATAVDAGDFVLAARTADEALTLEATNAEARILKARALEGLEDERRRAELDRAARDATPTVPVEVSAQEIETLDAGARGEPIQIASPPPAPAPVPARFLSWKLGAGLVVAAVVISTIAFYTSRGSVAGPPAATETTTKIGPANTLDDGPRKPPSPVRNPGTSDDQPAVDTGTDRVVRDAQTLLTQGDLAAAAGLIVDGLQRAPGSAALLTLREEVMVGANDRAEIAQRNADRAGRGGRREYGEAQTQRRLADKSKRARDVKRAVGQYLNAAELFGQSQKAIAPVGAPPSAPVTTELSTVIVPPAGPVNPVSVLPGPTNPGPAVGPPPVPPSGSAGEPPAVDSGRSPTSSPPPATALGIDQRAREDLIKKWKDAYKTLQLSEIAKVYPKVADPVNVLFVNRVTAYRKAGASCVLVDEGWHADSELQWKVTITERCTFGTGRQPTAFPRLQSFTFKKDAQGTWMIAEIIGLQ